MSARWTGRLAGGLFGVNIALLAPVVMLGVLNRQASEFWRLTDLPTLGVAVAVGCVGLLLAIRRPDNPIGWLFLATGVAGQLASLAVQWGMYGLETQPGVRGAALALWLNLGLSTLASAPMSTFVLLLFPIGRFPDRRARVIAGLAALFLTLLLLGLMNVDASAPPPGLPALYARTPNPMAPGPDIFDPGYAVLGLDLCGLAAIALVVGRFRAARGAARQQYKWVVLAMAFGVAAALADFVGRAAETSAHVVTIPVASLAAALVPTTIGVAILRYRLFDIDRVLSRALVYAALSAGLVGAYALGVVVLQALLDPLTRGSDLAVAGTTLLVAVLARPLRSRIQQAVDKRFNRARFDAERTIAAFSARLRAEVDLEAIGHDLQAVVAQTMQPSTVSLWLRTPAPGTPRESAASVA